MFKGIKENPVPAIKGLLIANLILGLLPILMQGLLLGARFNYAVVIFSYLLGRIPTILLLVHMFAFYGRYRTQWLPPIALGLLGVTTLAAVFLSGYFVAFVRNVFIALIAAFIAVDSFRGYKMMNVSRRLAAARAAITLAVGLLSTVQVLANLNFNAGGALTLGSLYAVSQCVSSAVGALLPLSIYLFLKYAALPPEEEDVRLMLIKLNEAYDLGSITPEEYGRRKTALLKRI